MLKNMIHWQVMSVIDSQTSHLFDMFGDRYDLTESEKELLRLLVLFGFEDSEIRTVMQLTEQQLNNHYAVIWGKTRTNTPREVQALFLRFTLHRLPA